MTVTLPVPDLDAAVRAVLPYLPSAGVSVLLGAAYALVRLDRAYPALLPTLAARLGAAASSPKACTAYLTGVVALWCRWAEVVREHRDAAGDPAAWPLDTQVIFGVGVPVTLIVVAVCMARIVGVWCDRHPRAAAAAPTPSTPTPAEPSWSESALARAVYWAYGVRAEADVVRLPGGGAEVTAEVLAAGGCAHGLPALVEHFGAGPTLVRLRPSAVGGCDRWRFALTEAQAAAVVAWGRGANRTAFCRQLADARRARLEAAAPPPPKEPPKPARPAPAADPELDALAARVATYPRVLSVLGKDRVGDDLVVRVRTTHPVGQLHPPELSAAVRGMAAWELRCLGGVDDGRGTDWSVRCPASRVGELPAYAPPRPAVAPAPPRLLTAEEVIERARKVPGVVEVPTSQWDAGIQSVRIVYVNRPDHEPFRELARLAGGRFEDCGAVFNSTALQAVHVVLPAAV